MVVLITKSKNKNNDNEKILLDCLTVKGRLAENYDLYDVEVLENENNYFVIITEIEQFSCDILKVISHDIEEVLWDVIEDEYFYFELQEKYKFRQI